MRVQFPFLQGFSSVKHLQEAETPEPDEVLPHTPRTACLLRLYRALQDASLQKLASHGSWENYDAIYIDGGNLAGVDFDVLRDELRCTVWQGHHGRFAGEPGGLALLEENGLRGMVCDLGQTSIKLSWAGQRWSFDRDWELLPERPLNADIAQKGAQRRALRTWMAQSIRHAVDAAHAGQPQALVCALPSALDQWGQPKGSSYTGMNNDTQLLPDTLELAGWNSAPVLLLNDAELAGLSALADPRTEDATRILVITLGFAIGTATLDLMKHPGYLQPT
jgi:hypothetical protein